MSIFTYWQRADGRMDGLTHDFVYKMSWLFKRTSIVELFSLLILFYKLVEFL